MKSNKTIILIAIINLAFMTSFAQKKNTYGVGLDIFQTMLINVDREHFSSYGYSVPGFKQNDRIGFGANFLMQRPIYKNLSFETGLGITSFRSQFKFDYIDNRSSEHIESTLSISLFYLKIPLFATYNFHLNQKSSINLSAGLNLRILCGWHDNYQEIIREFIMLPKGRYKFIIASPSIALGYTYKLNNNNGLRVEANAGFDLRKFTYGGNLPLYGWGFYRNLASASYQYYGLSVKYFFSK